MLFRKIRNRLRLYFRKIIYNIRFFFNSWRVHKNDPIEAFQLIWKYGYIRLGDITRPMGDNQGLGGDPHELYLKIIKPYIRPGVRALEIGSGRGAYTRGLLPADEIWVLEAQPRWMTRIDEHLDYPAHLKFIQVKDFSCRDLPENHFDYLISMGTFYFFTPEQQTAYFKNLFSKMKPGANCFVMVTDFEKYKNYTGHYPPELDGVYGWKHNTQETTCNLLQRFGWQIVSPDLDLYKREVIIHFRKPLHE